ncbi:MAG: oligosaccharide flippase family protein [Oscillospiraceae bacterium]|jgi:stage V sporulation protein B|nr:oligosaccharide flippase family protein [Oscillospiraceae bacterium]
MSRTKKMLWNTALLTATALLMRGVGMAFQVWLTRKIGASGIGLFQLIMSVSMLAATFAISGIRFAATRLVSMELGANNESGVAAAMKRCIVYALCFGAAASVALWFGAPLISSKWIGDARTELSLRVLSCSLLPFALTAVLEGYFTAVCRVIKSASVNIIEQFIRIGVIVLALSASANHSLEASCAIIVAGGVVGEITSFFMLLILYLAERRKMKIRRRAADAVGMTRRMFGIALPLAVSAYARTALNTLQHMLVPRGFRKSGASADKALADYGTVHGMALPIIMFPSAVFTSFAELIVPELTDAQVRGEWTKINMLVRKSLTYCLLFSVAMMTLMIGLSDNLGMWIYKSAEIGKFLRILAWLMPVMYLDSVTDGIMRGLGEQVYVMGVNIADSLVSVVLVWFLLPRYGVAGYLFMVAFTEIFNFAASILRLFYVLKKPQSQVDIEFTDPKAAPYTSGSSRRVLSSIRRAFRTRLFRRP